MKRVYWTTPLIGLISTVCFLIQPVAVSAQDPPPVAVTPAQKTDGKASSVAATVVESDDTKKSDEKKKTETVKVEVKTLMAYESFSGVFEATKTHEVKTDFENWTDLVIKSAIEEGSAVSAGDRLLEFETESIDKAVAEAEFAVQNAEFDLQNAELEMKQANETFELESALAERSWKNAQDDYQYYLKTRLPQQVDDLAYNEKSAGYYLEYSKDELDQLQQMYNEDELTEESEMIVLKRAERDVESAQRSMDRTMTRLQRQKETEIPREKIQQVDSLKREEMSYAKSLITLPIKKQKAEIALAQSQFTFRNKQKALADLKADQAKMTLVAPANGIVYYGRCVRGKWTGAGGSGSRQLEPNNKLAANAVPMTLVDIDSLVIRANIAESALNSLAPRMRGKALITSASNSVVPVLIKSMSRIPLDDGKFDCQILVEKMPADGPVMPGMGCKLSFLVHENKQALVLPKASVFSDDDGVTHYVYLMQGEEPKRTEVTVGYTAGDNTEILTGLSDGDQVSKAKP